MAVSALFVLDIKGRCLISRHYRGDISSVEAERFFSKLLENEEDIEAQGPVVFDNGVSHIFIRHNNVYLMSVSRKNCNVASLIVFLHRLADVFKYYFEELEEESLRDNFVVVYELLDEMMDFGYPQYTEAKILSEFIKTDAYKLEVTQRPPMAVTNAVSWRNEGIHYKKNEVFLDVIESINILVNSNRQIIRSEVVGALKMKTCLSGMPECKLGLNDRFMMDAQGRAPKGKSIDLEDIRFHQCVRLARFESDRTISFIPPDGAFDLMTYRLNIQLKPLIWVEAQFERHARSRIEMLVKARSQFRERSNATNVQINIPVPSDATKPIVRTSIGSASYAPEQDSLIWRIKSFPGDKEYMLGAEFSLPSVTQEDASPDKKTPIRVKFDIPYFTVSGIQVRHLKVIEKSGYQTLPWVRYITMAVFKCLRASHAQDFLLAIPIDGLGQHTSPVKYRTILKDRLMIPLFPIDEICPVCRKACLGSFGEHAVRCKEFSGFKHRHDMVRDVHFDVWKHVCVDLTEVSPLVGWSSRGFTVGQAALKAASCKVTKHEKASIENQHVFISFAFETFGFLAPEAVELLNIVQRCHA
nr:AP-1 complex subunit mu-2 [Tanacetum cinerariifolium]